MIEHPRAPLLPEQQRIYNAIPAVVVLADVEGKLIFLNKFGEDLFGCSSADFYEKTLDDLFNINQEKLSKFLTEGECVDSFRGQNGFTHSISWKNRLSRDEHGIAREWVCIGDPVSCSTAFSGESDLIPADQLFDSALEIARMGYWTFDLRTREYSSLSQSLFNVVNETITFDERKPFFDGLLEIVHFDDRARMMDFFADDSGMEKKISFRLRQANGPILVVYLHVIPIFSERLELIGQLGFFQDITERTVAEQTLQKREISLNQALRISKAGIWRYDTAKESLEFSDELNSLLGITQTEEQSLQGMIQQWVHPDDQGKMWEALCGALSSENAFEQECRIVDTSGNIHFTLHSGLASRDETGMVSNITGVMIDITPIRQREIALRESETRYRALFEQSSDSISIAENERLVECNRQTLLLFGADSQEKIVGKTFWELSPEFQLNGKRSQDYLRELIDRCKQGTHLSFDWQAKKIDGSEFDCNVSLSKIPRGETELLQIFLRDISEQKRATLTLELYRAYLSVLAEMRKGFGGRSDREIMQSFLISVVHHFGFCKTWIGSVVGKEIVPILHAGPSKQFTDVHSVALVASQEQTVFPLTVALETETTQVLDRLQESERFAPWNAFAREACCKSLLAIPLEIDGSINEGIVVYSAIDGMFDRTVVDYIENIVRELGRILSEKRYWERQKNELKTEKEKAENAVLAQNRFWANMSHEIRTPLTAILGFSEFFSETDNSRENLREAGKVIQDNAQYLLQLLNDVLDISKIEANKLLIEQYDIPTGTLLKEIESVYALRAREKGLELLVHCRTAVPSRMRTDPFRLKQVLLNLVGNAIKFTSQGKVEIEVSWIPNERQKKENGKTAGTLQLEVKDTGIGISPEQCKRIFTPFEQADSSTSREYGGTGLGLSIAKQLIDLLDGTLELESRLGEGSVFRIHLPQEFDTKVDFVEPERIFGPTSKEKAQPESSRKPTKRTPLEGLRILLAEDSRDNQRLFHLILTKAGAQVDFAENGDEAINLAWKQWESKKPFDVVLMDMQMPVRDGYSAARELRARNYAAPIIALTAHAMVEEKKKCIQAGCNDYAMKPIQREALIATILNNLR